MFPFWNSLRLAQLLEKLLDYGFYFSQKPIAICLRNLDFCQIGQSFSKE